MATDKIKITNIETPSESQLAQQYLFDLGFGWPSSGKKLQSITPNSLFAENGGIRFWYGSIDYNPNGFQEINVSEIKENQQQ